MPPMSSDHQRSMVSETRTGPARLDESHGEQAPWKTQEPPIAPAGRLGRFCVLRLVGQGGMGRVYAAYDPDLDRRVALKV